MPQDCDISQDELLKRFRREVKLQSEFDSPNIIKIIDSELDVFPPYFVMEKADCSLKDKIDSNQLDAVEKKKCLFDILNALELIHNRGFKHRDLKPANVLYVVTEGRADYAISDFGLGAAADGENSTLTGTGVQGGTLMYAAPELVKSFRRATPACDIYSFGAILHDFYVGTKRTPYAKQFGPGKIGEVISKCTETLTIRRYKSISDLRADLYEALSDSNYEQISKENKFILELLEKYEIKSEEWDNIFIRLEDIESSGDFSRELVMAFGDEHLNALHDQFPELLSAYALHLAEYAFHYISNMPFEFCDVFADQLMKVFDLSGMEEKAILAYALLVVGVSHNRWYVERKFANLVRKDADPMFIDRIVAESIARDRDIGRDLGHLIYSIDLAADAFHPNLARRIDRN